MMGKKLCIEAPTSRKSITQLQSIEFAAYDKWNNIPHYTKTESRIHGKTVADSWAGAVMQKLLAIQKYL